MKILAALMSITIFSSAFAEERTNWRGQWTPYVFDGVCRLSEWYVDSSNSNSNYWIDLISLSHWPENYKDDSIWAIANDFSIGPSEIFLVFSGPGSNDEILGEIADYPISVSIAGFAANKIDLPVESDGHVNRTAFILKEPESTQIIDRILKGEVVGFEIGLADDSARNIELTEADGAFFNVTLAQFKACIEIMPSNKSFKDAAAGQRQGPP